MDKTRRPRYQILLQGSGYDDTQVAYSAAANREFPCNAHQRKDFDMNAADASSLRKRLLADSHAQGVNDAGHIDLAACATVAYSSEDPGHPIENLLDGHRGTRWASARQNSTEQIVIEFDTPQSISRIVYEVEESQLERAQEVRVEVSYDGGHTYRQLRVQEYSFSPRGATFQHEDMRLNVEGVSHLRLTVVPNKNGSGTATLTTLRLYG